jgi:hypothetical protein
LREGIAPAVAGSIRRRVRGAAVPSPAPEGSR